MSRNYVILCFLNLNLNLNSIFKQNNTSFESINSLSEQQYSFRFILKCMLKKNKWNRIDCSKNLKIPHQAFGLHLQILWKGQNIEYLLTIYTNGAFSVLSCLLRALALCVLLCVAQRGRGPRAALEAASAPLDGITAPDFSIHSSLLCAAAALSCCAQQLLMSHYAKY